MRVLILSPYHSGSHRAWAEGYRKYSNHQVSLLTMPGRFWKWRMHGGSVTLSRRFIEQMGHPVKEAYLSAAESPKMLPDVIMATDMTDMSTFLALTRSITSRIPCALYMHENQLTYPLPTDGNSGPMRRQKGERDLHYAFVNYASMLAVDRIYYNSKYHRSTFLKELPKFLNHFPEYQEKGSIKELAGKSSVLHVGIDLSIIQTINEGPGVKLSPPLILWNHRWEYDKNPAKFFELLYQLKDEGLAYKVAICGQQFRQFPEEFLLAKKRLSDHIVYFGYAPMMDYYRLLQQASIVVSTAVHEFFGVSILEAICSNTFPVLPNDLSYPELIPNAYHDYCLYQDEDDALSKLRWSIENPLEALQLAAKLAHLTRIRFDWQFLAPIYDQELSLLSEEWKNKRE